LHQGRVKLEIPPLVENGNTVSMTISVDSPMTELDHVKSIHIFTEKNPQPNVTTFHLTPRVGRHLGCFASCSTEPNSLARLRHRDSSRRETIGLSIHEPRDEGYPG
jgi:Sulfur oxidation protein SoxY